MFSEEERKSEEEGEKEGRLLEPPIGDLFSIMRIFRTKNCDVFSMGTVL